MILLDFSSHGTELAVLELDDLPRRFTTEKGVKLEWPEYEVGDRAPRILPPRRQAEAGPRAALRHGLEDRPAVPGAKVACTLTTSAGKATVAHRGRADEASPPPIDEEAEEENAGRRGRSEKKKAKTKE